MYISRREVMIRKEARSLVSFRIMHHKRKKNEKFTRLPKYQIRYAPTVTAGSERHVNT
jgi:hypothetical protein